MPGWSALSAWLTPCLMLGALAGAAGSSVGAQPPERSAPRAEKPGTALTEIEKRQTPLDKNANWRVIELTKIAAVLKKNRKMTLRIVVVSPEEMARLGLKANGRVIYRIAGKVLEIITTNDADASSIARNVAALVAPQPGVQPPGTRPDPAPRRFPVPARVVPPTSEFRENPLQQNVSPS